MSTIAAKVAHVKAASQTRRHACHWPGCTAQVPPAKWGCTRHWFTLPAELRERIWRVYRIDQERDMRPSHEYVKAARAAQEWIKAYQARLARPQP